jgi:D-sedoheptulose 7-phosphate isomerase
MDYYRIIADNFQRTIDTIVMSVDPLAEVIERGGQLMAEALLADRKIIVCGNGVDAALAQLFTCNLLNRFDHDRPALPALTLGADSASVTAIAQSIGISEIFSRQLRALGQARDVLLCINSSTGTDNLLRAVQTAQERNMGIVIMSNTGDSEIGSLMRPEDVELRVDATQPVRIVEIHTMVIHHFCELIDHNLFGTSNRD